MTPQKHTKAKHSNAPSKMIVYFVILLGSHGLADFSTLCRLAESSMDKRHRGIPAGNYARNVYILGRGIVISHCVCILIYIYFSLLGAKGIATRSKDDTRGSWPVTTRSKKLLGAKGIAISHTQHLPILD